MLNWKTIAYRRAARGQRKVGSNDFEALNSTNNVEVHGFIGTSGMIVPVPEIRCMRQEGVSHSRASGSVVLEARLRNEIFLARS